MNQKMIEKVVDEFVEKEVGPHLDHTYMIGVVRGEAYSGLSHFGETEEEQRQYSADKMADDVASHFFYTADELSDVKEEDTLFPEDFNTTVDEEPAMNAIIDMCILEFSSVHEIIFSDTPKEAAMDLINLAFDGTENFLDELECYYVIVLHWDPNTPGNRGFGGMNLSNYVREGLGRTQPPRNVF